MVQTIEKKVICPICKKKLTSNSALKQHTKTSHPKNKKCKSCNKKFRTEESLSQHVDTVHQKKFK